MTTDVRLFLSISFAFSARPYSTPDLLSFCSFGTFLDTTAWQSAVE